MDERMQFEVSVDRKIAMGKREVTQPTMHATPCWESAPWLHDYEICGRKHEAIWLALFFRLHRSGRRKRGICCYCWWCDRRRFTKCNCCNHEEVFDINLPIYNYRDYRERRYRVIGKKCTIGTIGENVLSGTIWNQHWSLSRYRGKCVIESILFWKCFAAIQIAHFRKRLGPSSATTVFR